MTDRTISKSVSEADTHALLEARHRDPFSVLGPHRDGKEWAVRALLPSAVSVTLRAGDDAVPMDRLHEGGLFEAKVDADPGRDYLFEVEWDSGDRSELRDPYAFPSGMGEVDLHLMGEGTDLRLHEKLGAHPVEIEGVAGVRFAVWAPNAERVSVVGNFNAWDGRRYPMRLHPGVGIWEIFLPDLGEGALYKYEIRPREGEPFQKSDPLAFRSELRPQTASVVHRLGGYEWGDHEWMGSPERGRHDRPMSVYEVHAGSWRFGEDGPLGYRDLAHQLGDYVSEMGFTHVEFLPVAEHPYDPSWGYQVTGYFAPTSRYGAPDDFKYLVDHLHQRGIGVIVDWVPAHFPRDQAGLRRFDGTPLYEHEDPRQGEHPDWGTLIFNFGRNEVRNFLLANALFWLQEYHIDGLRVDAVASMLYLDYSREPGQWVPNQYGGRENLESIEFLRRVNEVVHREAPGVLTIAEESTAFPGVTKSVSEGGLGFSMKWNMGWMNDFLRFMEHESVHRQYHFNLMTFSLMYAFSERFMLPLSHDEVVHGKKSLLAKMPGDDWQKAANLRLALGFMWAHPGKKLIFMGIEFGEWEEWSEARPLNWGLTDHELHRGVQGYVRDLNRLYRERPALWEADDDPVGFEWIDFQDQAQSVLSFLRRAPDAGEELVFVCNFTPVPREGYRVGVPQPGTYDEILNGDSGLYGGSNMGNQGAVHAEEIPAHGQNWSVLVTLPPLAMVVLAPRGSD